MALVLVIGVPMLVWGIWRRLGRTPGARAWATRDNPERWLFLVPFLGAAFILTGVGTVLKDQRALAAVLGLLGMLALAIALVFGLFNVPAPGFLEPRWYRELEQRGGKRRTRRTPAAPAPTPAPGSAPGAPHVDPAWAPVRDALRADIAGLEPEGSVMLTADAQRFVEVYHYGDRLSVDCAGSQEWGGPALTDAAQDQALVGLGFTTPMERRGEIEVHTGFRRYLANDRPDTVDLAADLAVAALAILGVQPTDHLAQVVS